LWCAAAWVTPASMATAASSSMFDLNRGCSWLDDPSNVAFAATVSAPQAEPNVVPFLGGGETSGASRGFSGKTERAGVWTVDGMASKPDEAAGSGRRGSISTPRSRAPGSAPVLVTGFGSGRPTSSRAVRCQTPTCGKQAQRRT
jgi:hypothetical protein